ncbi:hypothetical protein ACCT04_36590, partial [Rhizobium ruizarguesonis]
DIALASEAAQFFGRDAVPPYTMILAYGITAIVVFVLVSLIFGPIFGLVIAIPVILRVLQQALVNFHLQRKNAFLIGKLRD